jgi:hypothetical protein
MRMRMKVCKEEGKEALKRPRQLHRTSVRIGGQVVHAQDLDDVLSCLARQAIHPAFNICRQAAV